MVQSNDQFCLYPDKMKLGCRNWGTVGSKKLPRTCPGRRMYGGLMFHIQRSSRQSLKSLGPKRGREEEGVG